MQITEMQSNVTDELQIDSLSIKEQDLRKEFPWSNQLSPTERKLFSMLYQNRGRMIPKDLIYTVYNNIGVKPDRNVLAVQIHKIRRMLKKIDPNITITTSYNYGYRLNVGSDLDRLKKLEIDKALSYNDLLLGSDLLVVGGRNTQSVTLYQHRILSLFLTKPQQLISICEITEAIYGKECDLVKRVLDAHISNIRQLLRSSSSEIITIHGTGYVLLKKNDKDTLLRVRTEARTAPPDKEKATPVDEKEPLEEALPAITRGYDPCELPIACNQVEQFARIFIRKPYNRFLYAWQLIQQLPDASPSLSKKVAKIIIKKYTEAGNLYHYHDDCYMIIRRNLTAAFFCEQSDKESEG